MKISESMRWFNVYERGRLHEILGSGGSEQPPDYFYKSKSGKLSPMNNQRRDELVKEVLASSPHNSRPFKESEKDDLIKHINNSVNYLSIKDGIIEWKQQVFKEHQEVLESETRQIQHSIKYQYPYGQLIILKQHEYKELMQVSRENMPPGDNETVFIKDDVVYHVSAVIDASLEEDFIRDITWWQVGLCIRQ